MEDMVEIWGTWRNGGPRGHGGDVYIYQNNCFCLKIMLFK